MSSSNNQNNNNTDGAGAQKELEEAFGQGDACTSLEEKYTGHGDLLKPVTVDLVKWDSLSSLSSTHSKTSSKKKAKDSSAQRRRKTIMDRGKARYNALSQKRKTAESVTCTDTEVDTDLLSEGEGNKEMPTSIGVLNDKEYPALPVKPHMTEQEQLRKGEAEQGQVLTTVPVPEKVLPLTPEQDLPSIPAPRKRGRPPGPEYEIRKAEKARKEEEREALWEQNEALWEQEILNPLQEPHPGKSYYDFLERIRNKGEEYYMRPIPDLAAIASEKATALYKVAVMSKHLKGPLMKHAKEAAADMCAAASTLAIRAQNPIETSTEKQMRELQNQIHQLRLEKQQLARELERARRKNKPRRKLHSETSDDEWEEPLSADSARRRTRARKRADGAPLPPRGGGAPSNHGDGITRETSLPPAGGEASLIEDVEMRGVSPPPFGGEIPSTSGIEEMMEVEKEVNILSPPDKTNPPTKSKRRGQSPLRVGSLHVSVRGREYTIPQENVDKEEKEKEKHIAWIAMVEGIIERTLDKRFGCPIPTYGETLRNKKEAKLQQAEKQTISKQMAPVVERNKNTTTKPVVKSVEVVKKTVKIKPAMTLNPPSRPATERFPQTQKPKMAKTKEGEKLLPSKKSKGKKQEGNEEGPKPLKKEEKPQVPKQGKEIQKDTASWSEVVSRKSRRAAATVAKVTAAKKETGEGRRAPNPTPPKPAKQVQPPTKRKEPRRAAVTITCPPGTYEQTLREARLKTDAKALGIEGAKIKRGVTGSYIFEIPGANSQEQADKFALELKKALAGKEGVRVQRPTKMAEIRLRGLDESIQAPEVKEAVAATGGCEEEDIHTGEIRKTPGGMGIVWVRCPLKAANNIMKTGMVKIGWALARAEMLEARPLQCYKCLEGGHVRARCPNNIDRSGKCYRCGEDGHTARKCTADVRCPVCADKGLPAKHRTGSKSCTPVHKGKRGVPLNKSVDRPNVRTKTPAKEDKRNPQIQEEDPPLIDFSEEPKEQRAPRTRGEKREEGKLPAEGGAKRQRLRKNLEEENPTAMEVTGPADVRNEKDGL